MDHSELAWLHDNQRAILCVLVSFLTVYGGWRHFQKRREALRRARRVRLVEMAKRDKDRNEANLKATLSDHASPPSLSMDEPEAAIVDALKPPEDEPGLGKGDAPTQPKRSKERRKRGRDVFKDIAKHDKKGKVAKPMQNGKQPHAPTSSSHGSNSSRSPSAARSVLGYDSSLDTPRASNASRMPSFSVKDHVSDVAGPSTSVPEPGHEDKPEIAIVSPTPQVAPFVPTLQERSGSPRRSRSQRQIQSRPTETPSDDSAFQLSSPSTSSSTPSILVDDLPSQPSVPSSQTQPLASSSTSSPQSWLETLSTFQTMPASETNWDTEQLPNFRRTPPPRFRPRSRASASPLPSGEESLMFASLNPAPTPNAPLTTQLASYKGALEAARIREEQYKQDLERYSKECEILRWRWNEDAATWKRREAELQSHIHQLMHQIHALSVVSPHRQPFLNQAQHSPHSPQAHPPFGYPSPTPRSPFPFLAPISTGAYGSRSTSASASPAREYMGKGTGRRMTSAAGSDDGGGLSEQLAEAILKRPDSLRRPGSRAGSGSGTGSRPASVLGRASRGEVTFPSLSELGNPRRAVEMDTQAEADAENDGQGGGTSAVNGVTSADGPNTAPGIETPAATTIPRPSKATSQPDVPGGGVPASESGVSVETALVAPSQALEITLTQ